MAAPTVAPRTKKKKSTLGQDILGGIGTVVGGIVGGVFGGPAGAIGGAEAGRTSLGTIGGLADSAAAGEAVDPTDVTAGITGLTSFLDAKNAADAKAAASPEGVRDAERAEIDAAAEESLFSAEPRPDGELPPLGAPVNAAEDPARRLARMRLGARQRQLT